MHFHCDNYNEAHSAYVNLSEVNGICARKYSGTKETNMIYVMNEKRKRISKEILVHIAM